MKTTLTANDLVSEALILTYLWHCQEKGCGFRGPFSFWEIS